MQNSTIRKYIIKAIDDTENDYSSDCKENMRTWFRNEVEQDTRILPTSKVKEEIINLCMLVLEEKTLLLQSIISFKTIEQANQIIKSKKRNLIVEKELKVIESTNRYIEEHGNLMEPITFPILREAHINQVHCHYEDDIYNQLFSTYYDLINDDPRNYGGFYRYKTGLIMDIYAIEKYLVEKKFLFLTLSALLNEYTENNYKLLMLLLKVKDPEVVMVLSQYNIDGLHMKYSMINGFPLELIKELDENMPVIGPTYNLDLFKYAYTAERRDVMEYYIKKTQDNNNFSEYFLGTDDLIQSDDDFSLFDDEFFHLLLYTTETQDWKNMSTILYYIYNHKNILNDDIRKYFSNNITDEQWDIFSPYIWITFRKQYFKRNDDHPKEMNEQHAPKAVMRLSDKILFNNYIFDQVMYHNTNPEKYKLGQKIGSLLLNIIKLDSYNSKGNSNQCYNHEPYKRYEEFFEWAEKEGLIIDQVTQQPSSNLTSPISKALSEGNHQVDNTLFL